LNFEKLNDIRCFLLDMDGTFYLGDRLLPGAQEFIELMRGRNLDFLFLTNNSSLARADYAEKLKRLGLDIGEDKIFTSGEAAAIWLQKQKENARVYVVGTPALENEFTAHGFQLVDEDCEYAVLGFDTTLTYDKLHKLCNHVRSGIPYIATHPDINCPTDSGYMPDTGSFIAFVKASTGRGPDTIIGKPHRPILDALMEKTPFPVSQIAMVGDRLYTDIALGETGLTTVLVLTGETNRQDLKKTKFHPDYVMENLAELVDILERTA